MSWKERDRLTIMIGIKQQELTLVAAAEVMAISYRQTQRVLARYAERYGDFGPTLAAEYLAADDGLQVDHETLRRWLLAAGKRHRAPAAAASPAMA